MGLQAILILFVIYGLIATWVSAGTIPGLMYYGLSILTPDVFLPATALLAMVVAFSIGSSWTTAGTLGVAFIGIGSGLGVPTPMTAGAILSGAYAGDKQSPLSDTTNLAAAVTNTDLYDHIRAMRNGTVLAFGLSVLLYAALGLRAVGEIPTGRVAEIQAHSRAATTSRCWYFSRSSSPSGWRCTGSPRSRRWSPGSLPGPSRPSSCRAGRSLPPGPSFSTGRP